MPILSNFPTGGNSSVALAAVSNIKALAGVDRIYISWTDPADAVDSGALLAAWEGTLLVRKVGSMPTSRYDGTIVLDNKTRDAYSDTYFCDSGLANNTTYYYKFFPYTTSNVYTDSKGNEFSATTTPNSLNAWSWDEISKMSASGDAKNCWSLGDCKEIAVKGNVYQTNIDATYCVFILGFEHNGAKGTMDLGLFKSAISNGVDICLTDSMYGNRMENLYYTYFSMTSMNINENNVWKSCQMRYSVLGSTRTRDANAPTNTATEPVSNSLMAALPADMRAVMKPMTVYTNNSGYTDKSASAVTATVDYLPLMSEFEVLGARQEANEYEKNYQAQYAYFATGNSSKKYGTESQGANDVAYWSRSISVEDFDPNFCYMQNGTVHYTFPDCSYGVSPVCRV